MWNSFYICTLKITNPTDMDLVNRLKFFLESNNIAISQFADTCRIPRPTLSQILNGRNKKISDELISKIHAAYPSLSVLWLMFGEGDMESFANNETSEPQKAGFSSYQSDYPAIHQSNTLPFEQDIQTSEYIPEKPEEKPASYNSAFSQDETVADDFNYNESGEEMPRHDSGTPISFYNPIPKRPAQRVEPMTLNDSDTTEKNIRVQPANIYGGNPPSDDNTNFEVGNTSDSADTTPHPTSIPLCGGASISLDTPASKKITNIVVFYSDNSFQSFYPTK